MDNRRPYEGPGTVAGSNPSQRNNRDNRGAQEGFVLSAVIITDSKRMALVQMEKNKETQKLSEGDDIDGWIITNIQPYMVSLEKGARTRQLELMFKASPQQVETKPSKIKQQASKAEQSSPYPSWKPRR
jgi:type II secretory pathway component PulC